MNSQLSHNQFIQLMLAEQYQYFQDNGFKIFSIFKNNSKNIYFIEKEKYDTVQKEIYCNSYNLSSYIKERESQDNFYSLLIYYLSTNSSIKNEFFFDFYKNHPECKSEFLRLLPKLFNNSFENIYDYFINNVTKNKEDVIELLHEIPTYIWKIESIPFATIRTYLIEKDFSEKDYTDFLYTFLKNREHAIYYDRFNIKNYLMEHFNQDEQQLKLYFDLLPVLKAEFIEPEITMFIHKEKFSDVLHLGINKMTESFLIENWQNHDYKNALFDVCRAIQKHYKLERCFTDTIMNDAIHHEDYYSISFLHNNDSIDKSFLEKIIIDYFKMLRINPEYINIDEPAESWLLHQALEKKVMKKDSNNNKKKI